MGWQNSIFQLLIIEGNGPGTGLFVYSGAPGLGNPPVLSIVSPGVTADPFGNAVTAVLEVRGSAGVVSITDPAVIQFLAGAVTTGSIKSESAAQTMRIDTLNGLSLTGAQVISAFPMFRGSDATASTPASWNQVTAPNFQNGWTGTLKWRNGVENEIKFQCSLSPGTDTDGTIITNLLGQSPAAAQIHAVWCNALRTGAIGTAAESSALQLDTSGNVKCFGIAAAATSVVGVGFWPLDN